MVSDGVVVVAGRGGTDGGVAVSGVAWCVVCGCAAV